MKNTYITTRKIQLVPVGDKDEVNRVYDYLREGIKNQNLAKNQYMSALYAAEIMEASKDDRKELNQLYSRISGSNKGSAYNEDIKFAKGLPVGADIKRSVKSDFDNAMKKGLKYGRISLPSYRMDNPLLVHVGYVRLMETNPHRKNGLYHNYANHEEFLSHLDKNDLEIFIKFANNITFKVIFGKAHKTAELRSVFKNIFESVYEVNGSSIEIKDTKIMLNLTIEMPKKEIELDENVVVGVDLGVAIPAMCAVNTNDYVRKSIGSYNDFTRVKQKIKKQRQQLQTNLAKSNGGHGRNKKLKALNNFKDYESNWTKSYNHYVSKQVIDFALKNKAKYINLENLNGFYDTKKENCSLLGKWTYYQLQQMIIYKADRCGIEVRKINPYHTSQICSCCGHFEEGQRLTQSNFTCKNPKCKNYEISINADFNAARNIAKSTDFQID